MNMDQDPVSDIFYRDHDAFHRHTTHFLPFADLCHKVWSQITCISKPAALCFIITFKSNAKLFLQVLPTLALALKTKYQNKKES